MKEDPKRGVTQGFGNAHIFLGCIIYMGVFCFNYFRDIASSFSKVAKFSYPMYVYLVPPLGGDSIEILIGPLESEN